MRRITSKIIGTRDMSQGKRIGDYNRDENGHEYVEFRNIKSASIDVDDLLQQIDTARRIEPQ